MRASTRRQHLIDLSAGLFGFAAARAFAATEKPASPFLRKRGVERREFKDSDGRTIVQLTDNTLESKHSYYDACPFSSDGRYLLFSSVDPATLTRSVGDAIGSDQGMICVMDTKTHQIGVIAEGAAYHTHTGAFPLWHPRKNTVFYTLEEERIGAVDLDTGERSTMKGILRQLSPDGTTFAAPMNASNRPDDPDQWGFYTMREDGSGTRQIISTRRLHGLTPNRDEFDWKEMTVGNPKWSPDGKHLLITMWCHPKPAVRRSLYIATPDGSEIRWLTYFGHHHSWMPNGKGVLLMDSQSRSADARTGGHGMFLIDFDGSNRRAVIDAPVGSHPCMDPSCRMIADFDGKGIFIVHIDGKKFERVARFRKEFDMGHKGTHPHCVWNPKSPQVVYNSAETGHCELYMVTVKA